MKNTLKVSLRWLGRRIRGQLLAGILVILPIDITVWILVQLFNWIDGFLRPVIERIFGGTIHTGVVFGITVLLVYVVGVIASNVIGRRIIRYGESLLAKVPIARIFYTGIKQVLTSFSMPDKTGFMQVVLVEFPRKGTRTIGFITNEQSDESGKKLLNVFIPTAPNPTSGFLQILEEDQVIRTTISVDAAIKMIVSAGSISPQEVSDKLLMVSKEAGGLDPGTDSADLPHGKKEAPAGKNVEKQKTPRRPSSPKTG